MMESFLIETEFLFVLMSTVWIQSDAIQKEESPSLNVNIKTGPTHKLIDTATVLVANKYTTFKYVVDCSFILLFSTNCQDCEK